MTHEKCIRVHPYGTEENVPICTVRSCTCIILPGEKVCPSHTETEVRGEERIRSLLLANFCDGDSWEAADASSFTKHGALEIAEFFYHEGLTEALTLVEKHDPSFNRGTSPSYWGRTLHAAIQSKITSIREEV